MAFGSDCRTSGRDAGGGSGRPDPAPPGWPQAWVPFSRPLLALAGSTPCGPNPLPDPPT